MGILAQVDAPRGLPRGRGSLPPDQVARAQRERMLRAMTAVTAELGYGNVRVADVVERARVSRQSFYAQFADKEECFLAAHAEGVQVILSGLWDAVARDAADDPRAQLRAAIRTYLGLAGEEPEFAYCMLIELQAIGPAGLAARIAAHRQIAALLRAWHEQERQANRGGWPRIPASRYAAAVGAVHDLLFDALSAEREDVSPAPSTTEATTEAAATEAAALEAAALDAVLTLLEIPST